MSVHFAMHLLEFRPKHLSFFKKSKSNRLLIYDFTIFSKVVLVIHRDFDPIVR